ncbi:Protein CBR-MRPL-20 [Caenorhabditis briggsae]|uniref:Protein CBR-MRPL-20 n=1 Tax=Caenorhabditis briggsae TaxID=6238 RepID=A8XYM8_CAEBR|nr:Protein CBR-MRPL-20 [Caenorhabditis briggsae]CAP37744.2 Protein CBR-MRPL-20 [Caenorhabditis briggsae]
MHLSTTLSLRRILNSGFHPFQVIPKPDVWMKRERLNRFTAHAEERVRTALAEHDMEYPKFKSILAQSHILLDNIVLSQLAIYEPRSFKSLVAFAKELARQEGMDVIPDDPEFSYDVHVDNKSVLRKPLPRAVEYTRGASENHTHKPRKLRENEY